MKEMIGLWKGFAISIFVENKTIIRVQKVFQEDILSGSDIRVSFFMVYLCKRFQLIIFIYQINFIVLRGINTW